MGVFEFDKFAAGTNAVAQTLAECTAKVRDYPPPPPSSGLLCCVPHRDPVLDAVMIQS